MKIRYCTPFSEDKNLADAYNYEVSIGDTEYVAFVDRDTWWPDPYYGNNISQTIEENGTAFYTCWTNRINCEWQRADIRDSFDERTHEKYALNFWKDYGTQCTDCTHLQLWSGFLMIIPVEYWQPLTGTGILGVDNSIHKMALRQGIAVKRMDGIYLPHYYGGWTGSGGHKQRDKSHLK